MATKPMVAGDTATAEQDVETTLLDVQTAAVKRLIARGKERGYITFDELNAILPPDQNSSEQIEDVMANFSEMGIQVVESEETEDGEAPRRQGRKGRGSRGSRGADRQRRRGQPRPHRRSGAHVPARDGQRRAAVARGRNRHRQADRGRPRHDDQRAVRKPADLQGDHLLARPAQGRADAAARHHRPGGDRRAPARRAGRRDAPSRADAPADGVRAPSRRRWTTDDEDGEGPGMSLSALEEKLKPEVLANFEEIESLYKKLHKMQHRRLETMTSGEEISTRSEKSYEKTARGAGREGRPGAAAQQPHRGAGHPAQAAQPAPDHAGRPAHAHGRGLQGQPRGVPEALPRRTSWIRTGWSGSASCPARAGSCSSPSMPTTSPRSAAQISAVATDASLPISRVPPRLHDRLPRRARQRAGQEGDDRGEPAPGDLDRQEIHQSRPAVPGSDPGRQHRPDEGGR